MTHHQREHLRRLPRHERLARLLLLAKDHEINADPCTPERQTRGQRTAFTGPSVAPGRR